MFIGVWYMVLVVMNFVKNTFVGWLVTNDWRVLKQCRM